MAGPISKRNEEIRARLLAMFRTEAQEHLETITAHLAALERALPAAAPEALEAAFRAVHTLKGAARSVGQAAVETLCQACEGVLRCLTRGELAVDRTTVDSLQAAMAGVARLLAGAADVSVAALVTRLAPPPAPPRPAAGPAPPPPAPPAPGPGPLAPPDPPPGPARPAAASALPAAPDSIRLEATRLDGLLFEAEELLLLKIAAEERLRESRALCQVVAGHRKRRTARAGAAAPAPAAPPELAQDLRGVEGRLRELDEHLARDRRATAAVVDRLMEEMRHLRMSPAATLLGVYPLMVRDIASQEGKEVDWSTEGAELQIDRKILEAIRDPLLHLVRNAIDHGVEPPAVREAQGKPRRGRVRVCFAAREGGRIAIRVEDDGGGIDLARVRAAAVRARLTTPEAAAALSEADVLAFVFRSGFSTSPIVSTVSGHGLGLAIVQERVEQVRGHVRLESRPGAGTTVHLLLPASIATFRSLLVQAGGQPYLVPLESVERVLRHTPEQGGHAAGQGVVRWAGGVVPAAPLPRLLGLATPEVQGGGRGPGGPPPPPPPCVLVRTGGEMAGLLVEEVHGEHEVLVKRLEPPLVRVRNVAAAGLLGTGQLALILRPTDLLRSLRALPPGPAAPAPPPAAPRTRLILVVDDSITTRTMERNLLEAAGYQVRVAVDGLEAWTLLQSERVDLVVSDVDMPRLNGFELTQRIRGDERLAALPVVLVTALESREDKERGIQVGANAYVIKSSFDQSNLLEILERLA